MEKKLIIVTGFGPFAGHEKANASWEAVKLLPDGIETNGESFIIEKKLVPVIYKEVDKVVDEIWNKNPELVVHCGVDGGAKNIEVEKSACNKKFCREDYSGNKLPSEIVCLENNGTCCEQICTNLDVDCIVQNVNTTTGGNCLRSSEDAGDYLCGYIYLKSLDKCCDRCLFVHVPSIHKPFSSEETSLLIYKIIKESLIQIIEQKDITKNSKIKNA